MNGELHVHFVERGVHIQRARLGEVWNSWASHRLVHFAVQTKGG